LLIAAPKNDFAEVSKNLARYKPGNNFIELSKLYFQQNYF